MNITKVASWLVIICLVIYLLIIAKSLILPVVTAAFLWYLINTIAGYLHRIPLGGIKIRKGWCQVIASVILIGVLFLVVEVIVQSVETMVEAAPEYEARFQALKTRLQGTGASGAFPSLSQMLEGIRLTDYIGDLGQLVSGLASTLVLVILYTAFMLVEQNIFARKLKLLAGSASQQKRISATLDKINSSIRVYISVKTGISALTAIISYAILKAVGLDFAIFWSFGIFLLNFIPSLGSIFATILPVVFALIQFDRLTPILIILFAVGTVQMLAGNVLEPRLMGQTLNISPLVVLISLTVWGSIWGIMGMVFAVPIMVTMVIIMSGFASTRGVALMLTADGQLPVTED